MSTLTLISSKISRNFLFRLYKHYIIDSVLIVKDFGFKELMRRRGKKFLLVIIAYYFVRDMLIYVIIPYCIASGLF